MPSDTPEEAGSGLVSLPTINQKAGPNLITIVDYGMGNLHSVQKKLTLLKAQSVISSGPDDILRAKKIILPGVGHFRMAMENLRKRNLIDALNESVLVKHTPILGICLGMQLMTTRSEEGGTEGLGWFEADVVRFQVSDRLKFKVPHMGWNEIRKTKQSILTQGIPERAEFYFVHSYHVRTNISSDVLTETDYEDVFPSSIEKDNIFGVQYHPEKSHDVGETLLRNFIGI